MRVGVLAVQGAFVEHERAFADVGAETFEIRQARDLARPFDALVLPGGESTTQGKLLKDLGLFAPLKARIEAGLPVFATCAGLILLAERLKGDPTVWFGVLPVPVQRNAYGRQLGSFVTTHDLKGLGPISMTFIRAPYIEEASPGVDVLATVDDHIVAVKYHHQIGLAFHPELGKDTRIHQAFLKVAEESPHSRLPI